MLADKLWINPLLILDKTKSLQQFCNLVVYIDMIA